MSSHSINFKGVDLFVEYDYQPAEKEVRYYSDGSGYPGCPESFEITAVYLDEGTERVDITDLCEVHFEAIEQAIKEDGRDDY